MTGFSLCLARSGGAKSVESERRLQGSHSHSAASLGTFVAEHSKSRMNPFPLPIPEKLPARIYPCPIVEAAVELRFVSAEPWRNMPGLIEPKLRERYPQVSELPLNQFPEQFRIQDASFTYQPLLQYSGPEFLIRFGPRVLSLIAHTHRYPGWLHFREELDWLWAQAAAAGFVQEGERLGVRYVDFFDEDIFSNVVLGVAVAGRGIAGFEQNFSIVIPWERALARLLLANSVFLKVGAEPRRGSVLDLDVWIRLSAESVFEDLAKQVEHLHEVNKTLFFGLLKPEFLSRLNPAY